MKKFLTIFLMTFGSAGFCQICDTINGKLINCIDNSGLRQGYWELTKKNIIASGYKGLGTKEGCRYFEEAEYYPIAKGNYKDGKKTGTWNYYGDHFNYKGREITYYEDGSIKDKNFAEEYFLEINHDSNIIKGQIYHRPDSININCHNKECILSLKTGQEILSFQYDDLKKLEYELYRLKIGVYDREIGAKVNDK